MSTVERHEPCPKCRKDGHDNTGDNLARYADGGAYCFRCGYYETATGTKSATELIGGSVGNKPQPRPTCYLPADITTELPEKARNYLEKYSLTPLDISKNMLLWSEERHRIIFPYFVKGELVAWQGRDINAKGAGKWYSRGNLTDLIYILGNPYQQTVILVEDIISAIRCGSVHTTAALPLFGSIIKTKLLLQLNERFHRVLIWLDKDKEMYSRKMSKYAREFGMDCRSIVTDLDPKEYSDSEILDIIQKV